MGAVLTQNTSWKNVQKAIARMKECGVMDVGSLHGIEEAALADIIRPSGFFNIKSKRLKAFVKVMYEEFGGAIEGFSAIDTASLRSRLLEINGLGPETVDSILLYALERPVFVVDAYTKRFLKNHGLYGETAYHDIQRYFRENIPVGTYLFNEFHALIVILCQTYCKKIPLCGNCPLKADLNEKST